MGAQGSVATQQRRPAPLQKPGKPAVPEITSGHSPARGWSMPSAAGWPLPIRGPARPVESCSRPAAARCMPRPWKDLCKPGKRPASLKPARLTRGARTCCWVTATDLPEPAWPAPAGQAALPGAGVRTSDPAHVALKSAGCLSINPHKEMYMAPDVLHLGHMVLLPPANRRSRMSQAR